MSYMKDWNEVVEYVEYFTQDIMMLFDIEEEEYDSLFDMLRQDISFYTLMILKNFS